MKAYKVFNPDWTCNDFQYEVGKTYHIDGELIMCQNGFHSCKKLVDCFNYYSFDPNNKVAEVELSGEILGEDSEKQCAESIKIVKELNWHDVLDMVNIGNRNSGYRNSGYRNSGDRNSGDWNSGDWNSGDWNSGDRNSGDRNSGDWNSGGWNSGDWNSGGWNSGYRNSGDRNSGGWNSGGWNSGDWNSGGWNSGDWNSGDWNSGFFNTKTPENIYIFDKLCDRNEWDKLQKPKFIYNIILEEWVYWDDMSDEEKVENTEAYTCDGYLKTYLYKEAWKNAYEKATDEDIELLKALPNFDAKKFEAITGIDITKREKRENKNEK